MRGKKKVIVDGKELSGGPRKSKDAYVKLSAWLGGKLKLFIKGRAV